MRALESCPPLFRRQEARRHLPQVEFPGFVPLARLGQFQGRGTNFQFVEFQNEVFRTERRERKNGGVEFNFAEIVPDLLNLADPMNR